jgi:Protein of unknown function (DUF1402)
MRDKVEVSAGSDELLLAKNIPYSGRAPYQKSPDPEDDRQRIDGINLIQKYSSEIKDAAARYGVSPTAIAGAILWEAHENTKPPLTNAIYNAPGRMHLDEAWRLNRDGKLLRRYPPEQMRNDPVAAIEYIAAHMNESAENYEAIVGINIRGNAPVLATLYHGGNSRERARNLAINRSNDIRAGKPPRSPSVPPEEMGAYVQKYENYINRRLLKVNERGDFIGRTGTSIESVNSTEQQIENPGNFNRFSGEESIASRRYQAIKVLLEKAGMKEGENPDWIKGILYTAAGTGLKNRDVQDIVEQIPGMQVSQAAKLVDSLSNQQALT